MESVTEIINSSTVNGSAGESQSKKAAAQLVGTSDQFLTILLAQLKHQDPLEPMKGTEFIDSISRLSNVEQAINTNTNLENIADILKGQDSYLGNPVSYIDKNISFNSSLIELQDNLSEFAYEISSDNLPDEVFITIRNSEGEVVVNTSHQPSAGENIVKWDGTDKDGNTLSDGLYTVEVRSPDTENSNQFIVLPTILRGIVSGADFTGADPLLNVGNITIPLSAVRSIDSG